MANKNRHRPTPSFNPRQVKSGWRPEKRSAERHDRAKDPSEKADGGKMPDKKRGGDRLSGDRAASFAARSAPHGDRRRSDMRPEKNSDDRHRRRPDGGSDKGRDNRIARQPGSEILFGWHAVRAALQNPARKRIRLWCLPSARPELDAILDKAAQMGLRLPKPIDAERPQLDYLSGLGVHQGVVLEAAPLEQPELDDLIEGAPLGDILVILDQVTDPHNIGAVIRSAAAFGARAVIQTERNAPGATGTLAKAASGGLEQVSLVRVVNLARAMRTLRDAGYRMIGFDERGEKTLAEDGLGDGRQGIVLVLGAEGEGLRRLTREHCDAVARLPTAGPVASLNVSNAAAIALYEAVRDRKRD